jgi:dihydroorotate dehydrogenase electron transfer subunit
MQPTFNEATVYENLEVSENIYKLIVKGDFQGKPGQFYMLRSLSCEPLLGRPISIHNIDENGITFIYQAVGKGTKYLSKLKCNDSIKLLGPLGNGFDLNNIKGKVALVAGGIGIAPLLFVARNMTGLQVDLYAGFRDVVHTVDTFSGLVNKVYVSTESGSSGKVGFVTDIFEPKDYDIVLCCGPESMTNKVVEICRKNNVPLQVSMEKHMACGVGACLVCSCKTKWGNKRTCKDGPVFNGEDLIL